MSDIRETAIDLIDPEANSTADGECHGPVVPSIVITPSSPIALSPEGSVHSLNSASSNLPCGDKDLATSSKDSSNFGTKCSELKGLCLNMNLDLGLGVALDETTALDIDGKKDIPVGSRIARNDKLLNVSVDTALNISRPPNILTDISETNPDCMDSDPTSVFCYSSTPLSSKHNYDACFSDNKSSFETTPSPIPYPKSAEHSRRLVNMPESAEPPDLAEYNKDLLVANALSGNVLPTESSYLDQSYNRAAPMPRFYDASNMDREDQEGAVGIVYRDYLPAQDCYFPKGENSWLDENYKDDLSQTSQEMKHCSPRFPLYPSMSNCNPEPGNEYFVYPSIYVSSAGLISVLLKNDMSVEMTVDRTIRVVSHNHMMAVATDSRGTAACLYHPAVKVFQIGTTTDIATSSFRARMGGEDIIVFSNGSTYFKLEDWELQPIAPLKFSDIGRDQSVNLLFSSEGYGESLVASCMQVAAQAEYANLPKGGVIVRINGVKVTQTGRGDVTVVTGAKFIRLSPYLGTTRLGNRFIDIEVEKDWSVKLTRGSHSFFHSRKCSLVSNGKMEAGYDENNSLKVINLQPRHPLLTDPSHVRRPIKKSTRPPQMSATYTPKRKPGPGFGSREYDFLE